MTAGEDRRRGLGAVDLAGLAPRREINALEIRAPVDTAISACTSVGGGRGASAGAAEIAGATWGRTGRCANIASPVSERAPSPSDPVRRRSRIAQLVFLACAIAAVVTGAVLAVQRSWMCDDAFITFRYADNLVGGHGLVFNAGERVEGFTNLLWTLWIALGLRVGVSAETWAAVWGIACFAATLALLAHRGWSIARASRIAWPLPAAAALAAIHHEWTVFATSGLETSAFTLLAFAGYLLVCPAGDRDGVSSGARDADPIDPASGPDEHPVDPSRALRDEHPVDRSGEPRDEHPIDPSRGARSVDPIDLLRVSADRNPTVLRLATVLARIGRWIHGGQAARTAGMRRLALAGLVFALASLTRPDGVLFAAVCGAWLLAGRDVRGALAFAAGFAALWLPATIWRIAYYGDVFPNTYYAKSAAIAWWSQGAYYAWIYVARYWPLALALPCLAFVRPRRPIALELALAVVYTLYVMRVGGDFMFGRLLVPVAPFLLIALERGLGALLGRRPVLRAAAIAGLGAVLVVMPSAVDHHQRPRGIADERDAYMVVLAGWAQRAEDNGAALAALFDGLPISVCFFGAQARLVYRSRVATAIECETGLTDAVIAHQELRQRGRIGHEKHAQLSYLVDRHVDFVLTRDWANEVLHLDDQLPDAPIELGRIRGRVITWDPTIMAALAERGVRIPNVPEMIDRYLERLADLPLATVRRDWERFQRLYFARVDDPGREMPFRARLAEGR